MFYNFAKWNSDIPEAENKNDGANKGEQDTSSSHPCANWARTSPTSVRNTVYHFFCVRQQCLYIMISTQIQFALSYPLKNTLPLVEGGGCQ